MESNRSLNLSWPKVLHGVMLLLYVLKIGLADSDVGGVLLGRVFTAFKKNSLSKLVNFSLL